MFKSILVLFVILQASISLFAQEKEIIIKNGEEEIGGTLFSSDSDFNAPLVIMISGSGPQDRDETIVGFKPFRVIAEHLAKYGIPSYRFDDRGVGRSTGKFNEATLEIMTSDVDAIVKYFKQSSEYSYKEFILLGHSQGGMVGARTASQNKDITKLILMASPTVPLKDVISEQIVVMQKAMGKTDDDLVQTLEFQEKAYETVRTDTGWEELKEDFKKLIEVEIAKLPEAQQAYITDIEVFADAQFSQSVVPIKTPQMRSLLFYDAGKDISTLNIPVLGLFGAKDSQVTEVQNGTRFEQVCKEMTGVCSKKVFGEGNHLFQKANSGLPMEYATLPKEFIDGFLNSISTWILEE